MSHIIRITEEEAKRYVKLDSKEWRKLGYDMTQVIAFTLTPIPEKEGWEKVTYYGLKNAKK